MMTLVEKSWRSLTLALLVSGTKRPKWVLLALIPGWLLRSSSPLCFLKGAMSGGKLLF